MQTAKIFTNGRSQAIRLPKECRFAKGEKEVYVHQVNGMVMLISKKNPWKVLIDSLEKFTPDFMEDRNQFKGNDKRKSL